MRVGQLALDIKSFAVQRIQASAHLLTKFDRDAQGKSMQGQNRLPVLRPHSQHGPSADAAEAKQLQHQQTRKLQRRARRLRLLDDAPRALLAAFMLQVREGTRKLQLGGQRRYRNPQSVHGIAEELHQRLEQPLGALRTRTVTLVQFPHGVEQQIRIDLRLQRLQARLIKQRVCTAAHYSALVQQVIGTLDAHRQYASRDQQAAIKRGFPKLIQTEGFPVAPSRFDVPQLCGVA